MLEETPKRERTFPPRDVFRGIRRRLWTIVLVALVPTGVPVKLFEYMATGRPIVYAGKGAADLLRRIGCAETVAPGDFGTTGDAVEALLRSLGRMSALGLRGRDRVRSDFHRDRLMEELARAPGTLCR